MARKVDELFDAAFEGRGEDVMEILATDLSLIHIGDARGDTAFHVAARTGRAATVLKLIDFLKEVDSKTLTGVLCQGNGHGDTPLHLAIKNGHEEVATHLARVRRVRYSLRMPIAVLIKNDDQVSPYVLAQQAGYKKLVTLWDRSLPRPVPYSLVCDMEMRMAHPDDDEDEKELIIVEQDEHKMQCKDDIGNTSILDAAYEGQLGLLKKMVQIIQSRSELKRQMLGGDFDNYTPLHAAVDGGQEKTARYLVDLEPRATYIVNFNGESPLYMAVKRGYMDLVRHMVRPNLSPSIRYRILEHAEKLWIAHTALKQRNIAVFHAIMEGLPELINIPDKKGWKLLSYAAYKGYFDEMCYIMNHFPDSIVKHDEDGSLPIRKAVAGGHVNAVREFILRCPRALHEADKRGHNLIKIATLYQSEDVVSYLQGQY